MTLCTKPLSDRLMDTLLRVEPVMAFVAKLSYVLYRGKLVLAFLLVACRTIPDCGRSMDKLFLPHPAVALIGNTGVLCLGIYGRTPLRE